MRLYFPVTIVKVSDPPTKFKRADSCLPFKNSILIADGKQKLIWQFDLAPIRLSNVLNLNLTRPDLKRPYFLQPFNASHVLLICRSKVVLVDVVNRNHREMRQLDGPSPSVGNTSNPNQCDATATFVFILRNNTSVATGADNSVCQQETSLQRLCALACNRLKFERQKTKKCTSALYLARLDIFASWVMLIG